MSVTPLQDHRIGWIIIGAPRKMGPLARFVSRALDEGLEGFSTTRAVRVNDDVGFGYRVPASPLPMTTWSSFSDERAMCFLEGVFYEDAWGHAIVDHEDVDLARIFLMRFRANPAQAVEQLNGAFAGFVYDYAEKRLTTFSDRLSIRMLYWSADQNGFIVASHSSMFRALRPLAIDGHAAYQFSSIGFPIGERTLVQDVFLQLPSRLYTFHKGTMHSCRYWTPPPRLRQQSLQDAVALLATTMEAAVHRLCARAGRAVGLALSGGHDSRVILSALAYRRLPFAPITWHDWDFNDTVATQLSQVVQQPLAFVPDASEELLARLRTEAFLASEGMHAYAYKFGYLAQFAAELGLSHLMLGLAGDPLSGIEYYQHCKSIPDMARANLHRQTEWLTFEQALSLLANASPDLHGETQDEWLESFVQEGDAEYLTDIAIRQSLGNRCLKRGRFTMIPGMYYVQLLFPYLDRHVMQAYHSLPIQYLDGQRAHCYVGFYRFRAFGDYQACGYPISLRREAAWPFPIQAGRWLASRWSAWRSGRHRQPWTPMQIRAYEEAVTSPLFKADYLHRLFEDRRITPGMLYKIQTLAKFYARYISSEPVDLQAA